MICAECKYADIAKSDRIIKSGNITVQQIGGGIRCTNPRIFSISFTDGDMTCGSFERKADCSNCDHAYQEETGECGCKLGLECEDCGKFEDAEDAEWKRRMEWEDRR